MTTLQNDLTLPGAGWIGSRIGRMNPDIFRSQAGPGSTEEDEEEELEETEENVFSDEPVDDEGNPTDVSDHGEHDHHQDDNYALGGHVTRLGSI